MPAFDDDYDVRTFDPALVDDAPDAPTRDWMAATRIAFHQDAGEEAVRQAAVGALEDGRRLTGVYATHPLPSSLESTWPVGTFAGFTKTINVGGALLDAYLISDVTVRPTHKRKGMLRAMMTERLRDAADRGLPLAALTASESTIYRRFGFGPATRLRSIVIRNDRHLAMHVEPTGRTELATAQSLSTIAREVFAEFHARTPGSIDRQHQLWQRTLGIETEEGKPDVTLRAAVHYAEDDERVDGYVLYRAKDEGDETTLEVTDLVASTTNAYLGLWRFVGSVDLVKRITFGQAAVDDALLHALVASRSLETDGDFDHVWLRILDPVAALSARSYAADGRLTLRVHDDLGFAEGVFDLTVSDGAGALRRIDADSGTAVADLELDAATLASLYLGGTSVTLLAEAGLVTSHREGAVAEAAAMFAAERPVYGITAF